MTPLCPDDVWRDSPRGFKAIGRRSDRGLFGFADSFVADHGKICHHETPDSLMLNAGMRADSQLKRRVPVN
jgi:hypothetical protein